MTGSIGTTRPMKKVTATRPRRVVASTMTNWATFLRKERRALPCPPPPFMTAEAIEMSVLLGLVTRRCRSKDGPRTKSSTFLRTAATSDLLQEDHERAVVENRLLQFLVHRGALLGVTLHHGGAGLGRQRARIPGIAPCEGLCLRIVRVVVVGREGVGVGVRVLVVRAPVADIDVVLAGAVLGERLLGVASAGSRA